MIGTGAGRQALGDELDDQEQRHQRAGDHQAGAEQAGGPRGCHRDDHSQAERPADLLSGLATAAAEGGASERAIMAQTGHRSLATVRRYIRSGSPFQENAAAYLGL